MYKTHKVYPKVAVYKKPEEHTGADFGLGEFLHSRIATVVVREKHLRDLSVIVSLWFCLWRCQIEKIRSTCALFYQKLLTRDMESFLLSNDVLDAFYIHDLWQRLCFCQTALKGNECLYSPYFAIANPCEERTECPSFQMGLKKRLDGWPRTFQDIPL